MTWLTENWVWVLFGVAFIGMHLFGHGGHGGQGGHGGGHCGHGNQGGDGAGGSRDAEAQNPGDKPATEAAAGAQGGREPHRH